ncbi:hypothetical protein EIN_247980, partial [Entamoeba invadens IP1]
MEKKKLPPTPPTKTHPTTSLDATNFDDIAFINQLLPEPNTKNFSKKFSEMTETYATTERELSQLVLQFFDKSVAVNTTIKQSAERLEELLSQTQDTMKRSVDSEHTILKVCDGMRKMGYAKRNLEDIIQVITHLNQLFNNLSKLDNLLRAKKYDDIILILQTTHLLLKMFEKFSGTENTISSAVERYDLFSGKVLDEAKRVIDQFEKKGMSQDQLVQFVTIVDSLNEKHISEFVVWMYNHLLVGYSNEFPLTGEFSGLENIDKRYVWFNKRLMGYEEMYGKIFPKRWRVGEELVLEFVSSTKVAFEKLLERLIVESKKAGGDSTNFTTKIVKALHVTIIFEQQLYKRVYHKEYRRKIDLFQPEKKNIQVNNNAGDGKGLPQQKLPVKKRASLKGSNPFDDESKSASGNPFSDHNSQTSCDAKIGEKAQPTNPFVGEASPKIGPNPFDDDLGDNSKDLKDSKSLKSSQEIKKDNVKLMKTDTTKDITTGGTGMEPGDAYADVVNPFDEDNSGKKVESTDEGDNTKFVVGALSRCFEPYMSGYVELEDKNLTTFVTNSLNEENFKEEAEDGVLSSCKDYIFYAKKCGERCIQITQGKPLLDVCAQIAEHAEQYARGISAKCKENDTIRRCCLAINTSDYLGGRLEQLLKGYTDMATVSCGEELEIFQFNIINRCVKPIIQQLVVVLLESVKSVVGEVVKMNWDISSESIDDEDDYVIKICEMINNQFGVIKANIFQNYYMRICHVTVSMIIDEMFETIFKCKKISVEGAQKMQMGYSQIKSSLQKLPMIEVQSCKETGKGEDVLSDTDYAMPVKKSFF